MNRRFSLSLGLGIGLILAAVFVGGFASGTLIERSRDASSVDSSDSSLRDFLAAYHLVMQQSYYRPFDRQHLIEAAIDGMLSATGDPHTLFLSPNENQAASAQLNGSAFSGIGAIVVPSHGVLEVVSPLPRAPAARAGLRAGDQVVKIDGQPVASMTGNTAVARIHGRAGSVVRLTVRRGHTGVFTVSVRRAVIPPITAYGRLLPRHLAYIQITTFGTTTPREVADALTYVVNHGARAIVLDLRGNPGGYVDAAQRVVSDFLSRGVVAYEQSPDRRLHSLPVLSGHQLTKLPVVALVDAGTASAAEITAAALHDSGRAALIGTRTYGKGSMQSVYALADGSSIRITDRLWLTPRKRSIQSIGVRPDLVVTIPTSGGRNSGGDRQLARAERYLLDHLGR